MNWSQILVEWYEKNQRDLPWRNQHNPYHTWLSEVILQQTRVEQGLPYFEKFVSKYPTLQEFANASEEDILFLWQGLGYYSRARNMLKAAQYITNSLGGHFNHTPTILRSIVGIGPYTANAIASIAYEYPVPVIDGNVYRVVARLYGIKEAVPSEKARTVFTDALKDIITSVKPSSFNQGLMELGALVCTPKNPKCNLCPIQTFCFAFNNKSQHLFPIKKIKKKATFAHYTYLHFDFPDNRTFLYRRTQGIWQGLHEFPVLITETEIGQKEVIQHIDSQQVNDIMSIENTFSCAHQLSHVKIFGKFWKIKCNFRPTYQNLPIFELSMDDIGNYSMHRLMKKYLDK